MSLLGGKCPSCRDNLTQILRGDCLDPPESVNVEDGPRVREDDGSLNPWRVQTGPYQSVLEISDISRQLT